MIVVNLYFNVNYYYFYEVLKIKRSRQWEEKKFFKKIKERKVLVRVYKKEISIILKLYIDVIKDKIKDFEKEVYIKQHIEEVIWDLDL